MKGILIDPRAQTIEPIDIEDKLEAIYAALECECVTELRLDPRHVIYLDDEGLYAPRCDFFALGTNPTPLANRALILGFNRRGDSTDVRIGLDLVRSSVRFLTPSEALAFAQNSDASTGAAIANASAHGLTVLHFTLTAPLVLAAIQRMQAPPSKPH